MDFDSKFHTAEAETGVRMVWNNLPSTKLAATRAVLPMAVNNYKNINNDHFPNSKI